MVWRPSFIMSRRAVVLVIASDRLIMPLNAWMLRNEAARRVILPVKASVCVFVSFVADAANRCCAICSFMAAVCSFKAAALALDAAALASPRWF